MGRDTFTAGRTTMTVVPAGDTIDLAGLATEIGQLLTRDGAVLVTGLELSTPDEFHEAVSVFGEPLSSYRGGNTPRRAVSDGVFTSTEYPPQYEISPHNELSYAHRWPELVFFGCLVPAETGGATPICDGRGLLTDLDPAVRDRFVCRGVTYHQFLHGGFGFGKSWQDTFETSDRAAVEEFLRDADAVASWTDDGDLRTAQHRPAVRTHPVTGETVWFNQADQWHPSNLPSDEVELLLEVVGGERNLPHGATYGDESPITPADLGQVRRAAGRHRLAVPWRRGDLMIVENMLVLHGRETFTGPRRIVVAMTTGEDQR